jgi:hypothetical protein
MSVTTRKYSLRLSLCPPRVYWYAAHAAPAAVMARMQAMLRWTERVIRPARGAGPAWAGVGLRGLPDKRSHEGAVILGEVDISVSFVDACEASLAGWSPWTVEGGAPGRDSQ